MRIEFKLRASVKQGAAALLLASVIFAIASCSARPTKAFHIVNTGAEPRSVTLQLVKEDGVPEEAYTLDKSLDPGGQVWEQVPSGKYFASVWNAEDKLVEELDTVDALLPNKKSDFNPIVIDLALDKNFAVANINYLYGGGALASIMSTAYGTDDASLKIVRLLDGSQAFQLEPKYRSSVSFVDIFSKKLPKSVSAGDVVYALVPISAEIKDRPKALAAVHKAVLAKVSP